MTLQKSFFDGSNSSMHLMRKVTQNPSDANLTTGVYEISFDVAPTADSWLTVSIIDTAVQANVVGNHTRNVLLNVVNKNSKFSACNSTTGYKIVWTDNTVPDGESWITQISAEASSWPTPDWWMLGKADETKPLQVKAIVNLDNDTLSTYVYQEGELVTNSLNIALNDNIKANGFQQKILEKHLTEMPKCRYKD